jgi:hypothetical protein
MPCWWRLLIGKESIVISHRHAEVDAVEVFFREAGPTTAPHLPLLHPKRSGVIIPTRKCACTRPVTSRSKRTPQRSRSRSAHRPSAISNGRTDTRCCRCEYGHSWCIFRRMSGQNSLSSFDTASHITCVPHRARVCAAERSSDG